jgi:uncharacterized membrane protein YccC
MNILIALAITGLVIWQIRDTQWYREMRDYERELKRDLKEMDR